MANDDADMLIVQTTISESYQNETVIYGQDVDLLGLVIALSPVEEDIAFLKEEKETVWSRVYNSKHLQEAKSFKNSRDSILFSYAFISCDTASGFLG